MSQAEVKLGKRGINAELMGRLAGAKDEAEAQGVRDELIMANRDLVQQRTRWFWIKWKGRHPRPTIDELV